MGGQACILYGAAEFSRDLDLVVLLDADNLERLRVALTDLEASPIAVPPFSPNYLAKGHAVHFRCQREDVSDLRIDIMTNLRGLADFETLWARRTTINGHDFEIDLLSIQDLVLAKKTQRTKDWPMIQRLLEQHYVTNREKASENDIEFWFMELRTPDLLLELKERYPKHAQHFARIRPFLNGDLDHSLRKEEDEEKAKDREYWKPLREELERLRHARNP